MTRIINLLTGLPRRSPDELFTKLLEATNARIERIVSQGHASPEGSGSISTSGQAHDTNNPTPDR